MSKIKAFAEIIDKIKYILSPKQRKIAIVLMFIIFGGSLLETLGVSVMLPFVDALLAPELLANKWYIRPFVELFDIQDTNQIIVIVGIGIILIYLIKNIYLYLCAILQVVFRSKVEQNLSCRMLKTFMNRPYQYYTNTNTAEVIQQIGEDVAGVYEMLNDLLRLAGEFFTALLIAIYIIYTDIFMAGSVIVLAGGCFLFITAKLKTPMRRLGIERREKGVQREKNAYQAIAGFKEIKVTHTNEHFLAIYEEAYDVHRKVEIKNQALLNMPERIIESLCVAGMIVAICLKSADGTNMQEFVPKLAIFAMAAFRLLPSVSRMSRHFNGVLFALPKMNKVYENTKADNEYEEKYALNMDKLNHIEHIEFTDSVAAENLSFGYSKDTSIFQNARFEIKKGEAVGVVGSSGSGKSTLADILLGLLEPQSGHVWVDGIDIYQNPKAWSEVIGYVPQSIFLSDNTIRNNVAFGIEDENIDDDKVWKSLEQAQLKAFVEELPDGINTMVGERGIKFSGGQRQRIAIARALYRNPEIIVFDEATSALDNETETAVMEAIDSLKGQKTLLIIAHRLSTLKNCSKILEVNKNGIQELEN